MIFWEARLAGFHEVDALLVARGGGLRLLTWLALDVAHAPGPGSAPTRALARKPVRMSAWTESPGLTSAGGFLIRTLTLNLMASLLCSRLHDRAVPHLGHHSVEGLVGVGVDAHAGLLVSLTVGIDVSSTSISVSTTDMSETVRSTVPGLVQHADDGDLPLLHPLGGDDAVHRGETTVVLRRQCPARPRRSPAPARTRCSAASTARLRSWRRPCGRDRTRRRR